MGNVLHYRKAIFLVTVELDLTKRYSSVRGLFRLSRVSTFRLPSDLQLVGNYSADFNIFCFLDGAHLCNEKH